MRYYLRVEGVNLGNFVYDTNDLATIRGGSLLLLEAMDKVNTTIMDSFPTIDNSSEVDGINLKIQSNNNSLRELSNKSKGLGGEELKKIRLEIKQLELEKKQLRSEKKALNSNQKEANSPDPKITTGASWGLFKLEGISKKNAINIKNAVLEALDQDPAYQYATFVINLYAEQCTEGEIESYQSARNKVQTLNRWQQLQNATFSLAKQEEYVCAIDKVTPAGIETYLPGNYLSTSVHLRRETGREEKKTASFYKKRQALEENSAQRFTNDLEELTEGKDNPLSGKMAFIYIDGNSFGKIQKDSSSPQEQNNFDNETRQGRRKTLQNIIRQIQEKEEWKNKDLIRLETLLWGGDEIIWVVPAWQGWWMVNEFYKQANEHIQLKNKDNELCHGSSIIFCNHKAPIHRIESLAKNLADMFAKKEEFKKENKNIYKILESFDHAGTDLHQDRMRQIKGFECTIDSLLLNDYQISILNNCIQILKSTDFPKRKIYQIVQAFRAETNKETKKEKIKNLIDKITGENQPDVQSSFIQQTHKKQLKILDDMFGSIFWIHLLELWDYMGLESFHKEETI